MGVSLSLETFAIIRRFPGNVVKYRASFLIWAVLLFGSCQNPYTGLGTALDLEAPEVTITSHKNMDYVGPFFSLQGTTKDNIQTTSVAVRVNGTGVTQNFEAEILENGTWYAEVSGLSDGEYQVRVTASDAAGNASNKSVATLTVVVDATSPSAMISEPALKSLTFLQNLWLSDVRDFDTVDYMKNNTVRLRGISEENFRLASLIVEIIHGTEVVATRNVSVDQALPPDMNGTIWNWIWNLDTTALTVGGQPLDPSLRYYFKVKVTLRDMNPDNPATILEAQSASDPGYFVVHQNADKPWSQVQSHSTGETLQPRAILSGNAWDDDGISGIFIRIQKASDPAPGVEDYSIWSTEFLASRVTKVYTSLGMVPRMYTWNINAPDDPGAYRLYLRVRDSNNTPSDSYQTLDFSVADQNSPMTVVTSPENQAVVPAAGKGDFTLSGYSYDNNNVSEMKMAWVPKGVSPAELLEGKHWSLTSGTAPVTLSGSGIKIWDLTSKLVYDAGTSLPSTRLVWNWSATFNVENDFTLAGKTEYADRQLIFYTRDTASNTTYTRLTLAGEREAPTGLTVSTPANDGDYLRAFAEPYENITGTVADGSWISSLTITWVEGKVSRVLKPETPSSSWNWSLSSKVFADAKNNGETALSFLGPQNLQFIVEDVYGNKGFSSRYLVVDSAVPIVTRVTSTEPNGYYGVGQILELAVEFSKPLNVTGAGIAALALNSGGAATYFSGTGTTSLVFRYTVGAGQNASRLNYSGTDSLTLTGTLNLKDSAGNNANLTLPLPNSTGALGQLKNIIIDTTAPSMTALDTGHVKTHSGAGTQISLQVSFDDVVTVSGTPEITLNTGGGGKALYSSGSGTNTLTFNYLVGAGQNSTALDASGIGALTGSIQDLAGNLASLTISIPSLLGMKSLDVDTTAPTAPTVSGLSAGTYNSDRNFTITGGEAGAVVEYSLNSGVTWNLYNGVPVGITTSGTYSIQTRQKDQAGNISDPSPAFVVTLDKTAPAAPFISGITGGDKSASQTFSVFGEVGAALEYSLDNGSNWIPYTLSVNLDPGAGLEATYQVLARQTDSAGNGPVSTASPITLKVDRRAPTVSAFNPLNNAVNVVASSPVVLTFSEAVWRESGNITLTRVNKGFPIIMSIADRNEYRSKLSGSDLTNFDSSYTLSTNGAPGGIPSTTGVYVLNFNIETNDATLIGIFDSIGYNRIIIPVDSTQITGSGTSTITVNPSNALPVGIEFYLEIPAASFRDSVGNSFAGLSGDSAYRFTTGPVASPIIRVQKQSGQYTSQPFKTSIKISTYTPDAQIYYTMNTGASSTSSSPSVSAPSDPDSGSTVYLAPLEVGTVGNYTQGEIHYIKALAKKGGLSDSSVVEEKAIRTVLATRYTAGDPDGGGSYTTSYVWYRGSNNSGGPTTAPGFPLAWEDDQLNKIKNGNVDTVTTPHTWYWITWEVSTLMEYKALWGDQPTDYSTQGPTVYSWESGSNKTVNPGGYGVSTPSSFEAWAAHTRPGTTVMSPAFSPLSGTVATGTIVTLSSATPGATIKYTTDGSDPKVSGTAVTGNSVTINASCTVKAYAFKAGLTDSATSESSYTAVTVYSKSILVDGANTASEWVDASHFLTTSDSKKIYFSWDGDFIYVGYYGEDMTLTNKALYLAIDSTPGNSSDGSSVLPSASYFEGSTVNLPFNATKLYFFKRNGSNNERYVSNHSGSWTRSTISDDNVFKVAAAGATGYTEWRISRSHIGAPSTFRVAIYAKNLAFDGTGNGWIFGVLADASYTGGTGAKTISKYGEFNPMSASAPAVQEWIKP